MKNIQKVSMNNYTSIRIGGEANMVSIDKESEITEVMEYAKAEGFRVYILGGGTNSFFAENISNTLVIKMEIKGVDIKEDTDSVLITAGAGETWDDIVNLSVNNNWWGLENLSYIPGTVGASPVQNIGAYGVELKDIFESVRVYDTLNNSFVDLYKDECNFGYRDSIFKQGQGRYVITFVTLRLSKKYCPVLEYKPLDILKEKENLTPRDVRVLVIKTRKEKLPDYKIYPNSGSFFKNPVIDKVKAESIKVEYPNIPLHESNNYFKIPAAWLIEHIAEMKGFRVGDIGTWPTQPLVIVNYGNTSSENLMLFSGNIINKIKEKTGIHLEREVNFVD